MWTQRNCCCAAANQEPIKPSQTLPWLMYHREQRKKTGKCGSFSKKNRFYGGAIHVILTLVCDYQQIFFFAKRHLITDAERPDATQTTANLFWLSAPLHFECAHNERGGTERAQILQKRLFCLRFPFFFSFLLRPSLLWTWLLPPSSLSNGGT